MKRFALPFQPAIPAREGALTFRRGIQAIALGLALVAFAEADRSRLIVLTDIGQDPDDQQSLIRLLHYANDFEIEGLVATADHNSSKEPSVIREDIIFEALDRYEQALPHLLRHDPLYPSVSSLRAVVKKGNAFGGNAIPVFSTIGEGRDTEGSDWIIEMGDRRKDRPLNVAIWGGASDFAQALWRLRRDRSTEEVDYWVSNVRVHAIGDQDTTSSWIRQEFPNLFYIHDFSPEGKKFESAYRGIFLGGNYSTLSKEWLYANIKEGHGPLGAFYPDRAWTQDNPHGCIKEGDTPSMLYFLRNGLQDPGRPDFGGWGGRFKREGTVYRDQRDTVDAVTSYRATVWRWRQALQNDFAARADWAVKPYSEANHPPRAFLNGDASRDVLYRAVVAREGIRLSANGSEDPDGDSIGFRWWVYPEAGSYGKAIPIEDASRSEARLSIPADARGKTIHVILEVQDDGEPSLVAYRRWVLLVGN